MVELFDAYIDSDFLDALLTLIPSVGVGVALALLIVVLAWVFGFIIRGTQDKL